VSRIADAGEENENRRAETKLTTKVGLTRMPLTQAVRIGGRLALLAGFAVLNLANGTTLSYFYGYSSSPNLSAWMSTGSSYGSPNVQFVTQMPLVSQTLTVNNNLNFAAASGNWGVPPAYAAAVAPSSSYSEFSAVSSSGSAWSPVNMSGTAYSMAGTAYSALSGSGASIGNGAWGAVSMGGTSFINVNGSQSLNAWFPQSNPAMTTAATGLAPIGSSLLPTVSSSITPVTNPYAAPSVAIPNFNTHPLVFGNPEPGTIALMASGVIGLALLRRRRRTK
jgi:hypothetical protein